MWPMAGCWQWVCLPPRPLPPQVTKIRKGKSKRAVEPLGLFHKKVQGGDAAQGDCRLIIVALDYKGSGYELSCTVDGDHMQALAKQCGVQDVTVAYNEQCTPSKFKHLFRSVGARCQPDDTLLFYFSGHGTCVKDLNGDESDGIDEAFVLVNEAGEINLETALITDDEFVEIMMDAVPLKTTIITICDCCHSGTIMDFNKRVWTNRKAVSISGSRETQISGERENGGICTHSILLAIESLQRQGLQSYPVKKLFKETLAQDEAVFSSEQDITLNRSAGCMQMGIPWPLIPKTPYTAPYRRPLFTGIPSLLLMRRSGNLSNLSSTTTAAPVDAPEPQLHMLDDVPVAAVLSSSTPPPEQVSPSLQALLSPLLPDRHVCGSTDTGDVSNTTASTTTAATIDVLALQLQTPPKLDTFVAAPRSSPPHGQASPNLRALLSPLLPGRGLVASAGTCAATLVASQPPFKALSSHVSTRASTPACAHRQTLPGPSPPFSVSVAAGAHRRRESRSGPCLPATRPPATPATPATPARQARQARPAILGYHTLKAGQRSSCPATPAMPAWSARSTIPGYTLKAGQHSSCPSPTRPAWGTSSMPPTRQWMLQPQQQQQQQQLLQRKLHSR